MCVSTEVNLVQEKKMQRNFQKNKQTNICLEQYRKKVVL